LGGYNARPPRRPRSKTKLDRGAYYWKVIPTFLSRSEDAGAFCKLDAEWNLPDGFPVDSKCAVGLIMYHFIEPPVDDDRVEWPLDGTRSIFWFHTPGFNFHERVLVFSVAKYIEERSGEEFEFENAIVREKLDALRRLGLIT
jgi:hypothetical protein